MNPSSCNPINKYNTLTIFTSYLLTLLNVHAFKDSSIIAVRPTSGRATLIPGQPLHFQCEDVGDNNAGFLWFKRSVGSQEETLLEPSTDDIEIYNNRLTLLKPKTDMAADYICRALDGQDKRSTKKNEFAVIRVRSKPIIEDFGVVTSHTGDSSIIQKGGRLELNCSVRDRDTPVTIRWYRSIKPEDDTYMMEVPDSMPDNLKLQLKYHSDPAVYAHTKLVPDPYIMTQHISNHSKMLYIDSVEMSHRSYYVCVADNLVTESARKVIFIRVKDEMDVWWPFFGILAEILILAAIIGVWETRKARKSATDSDSDGRCEKSGSSNAEMSAFKMEAASSGSSGVRPKRPATGSSAPFESVPLTKQAW